MSWRHISDSEPKARKPYLCELCQTTIQSGEVHLARRGISEGEAITARMHKTCAARTRHWTEDQWECHDPVEFREAMEREIANTGFTVPKPSAGSDTVERRCSGDSNSGGKS